MDRDGDLKSATVHHIALIHVTKFLPPGALCQGFSTDMTSMNAANALQTLSVKQSVTVLAQVEAPHMNRKRFGGYMYVYNKICYT